MRAYPIDIAAFMAGVENVVGLDPVVDFDTARKLPSLQHCATCHNQAAKQGYVFMPYLAKPRPAK